MSGSIFTNNALSKMKALGIGEGAVLSVYKNGTIERPKWGGYNAISKFPEYEIGVYYNQGSDGVWRIISVWRRDRR